MENTTIWTATSPSYATHGMCAAPTMVPPFGVFSTTGLLIAGVAADQRARNAKRGRPPRGELH